jgi:D-alanine-D-alanine ligase
MAKTVLFIHQPIKDSSSPDDADVLVQVESIAAALGELGYLSEALPFTLDLALMRNKIAAINPVFVVNLVESVEQTSALLFLAPALLDHMHIPYTGASTESLMLTTNKLIAKKLMHAQGIPTAPWVTPAQGRFKMDTEYICKPVSEEASVGIDQSSIRAFRVQAGLHEFIREKELRFKTPFFAEEFIDGREFNISIIQDGSTMQVLPPAEIKFTPIKEMKYSIVDYDAKWNPAAAAYYATPRSFEFADSDSCLLLSLQGIAEKCRDCFSLSGYARVDFRIDRLGNPYVLEINANPCIAPDSGFVAAAERAGLSYTAMVEKIIGNVVQRDSS